MPSILSKRMDFFNLLLCSATMSIFYYLGEYSTGNMVIVLFIMFLGKGLLNDFEFFPTRDEMCYAVIITLTSSSQWIMFAFKPKNMSTELAETYNGIFILLCIFTLLFYNASYFSRLSRTITD